MHDTDRATMLDLLARQRAAFEAARPEPLSVRRDRLDRLARMLIDNVDALAKATSADYGSRSEGQARFADIAPAITIARHCAKHLRKWSKTERRGLAFPIGLLGVKVEVRHEPKGVVGVVSPWNFPVGLSFGPIAQALAAGNRALLKPSEFTERTSELMAELVAKAFAPEELAVVTGGAATGQDFCALPFDHLLFTGSTALGRHVMRAAAENLVPVTLELGGKSPAIVGRKTDMARTSQRIANTKLINAGQVCIAPDYVMVPREDEAALIEGIKRSTAEMYPTMLRNDDYSSVVNGRHFERIKGLVADAVAKGAEAVEVNPAGEDFAAANTTKMPLTLLRNVTDDMAVMQEEIFGPVLPILTYQALEETMAYVNRHDRPLALYVYTDAADEREAVLTRTLSGGVTVNDGLFHFSADTAPFGGVGPSGMGAYHGVEGFRTFSHARTVWHQPKLDISGLSGLRPPYGKRLAMTLKSQIR